MRNWELTVQGRMVATLAALALCGAGITGDRHACLAAALLVAPLLVDWLWKCGGLPPLEVSVDARRAQVGSAFLEVVRLRNAGRRRAARDLQIAEPRIGTRAGGAYLEVVPAGSTESLPLPARCGRRGRFPVRMFLCESAHPLGLLRARSELRCAAELVCEPARVALPEHLLRMAGECAAAELPSSRGTDEFWALREYRFGEDARRVHALRSAATGVLVRDVTRGEAPRYPCVVLDLRCAPGRSAQHAGSRFEWSLGAAATLADELCRHGATTACFVLARHCRGFAFEHGRDSGDLLGFLADAHPSPYAALPADALDAIRAHDGCLWIPAGGFAASEERAVLRSAVLVTKENGGE